MRSFILRSSSGFASWFGKVPSGSQNRGTTSTLSSLRRSGANGPAAPFPASITILRGLLALSVVPRFIARFSKGSRSIFEISSSLYSGQMSSSSSFGGSSSGVGSSKSSDSISFKIS